MPTRPTARAARGQGQGIGWGEAADCGQSVNATQTVAWSFPLPPHVILAGHRPLVYRFILIVDSDPSAPWAVDEGQGIGQLGVPVLHEEIDAPWVSARFKCPPRPLQRREREHRRTSALGGNRAYRSCLGKDRSRRLSRHSLAGSKSLHRPNRAFPFSDARPLDAKQG